VRDPFLSPLVTRDAGDGRHVVLVWPFIYLMRDGRIIVVLPGFVTDYASIPLPFRWFLPRFGKYNFAAVLHDLACRYDSVPLFASVEEANQLMKDAMEDSPWPPNRVVRWVVNAGLAVGARHFFHQHPVAWRPAGLPPAVTLETPMRAHVLLEAA
jgi:hypothetical protein